MELTALRAIIILLELTCIAISISLVVLFSRIYKTKKSLFLLFLPLGFFFLLTSYSFLFTHHILYIASEDIGSFYNLFISSPLMWVRSIAQNIGFILIALSYFFAGRYQNETKHGYLVIFSGSTALLLLVLGLLSIINPPGLQSVYLNTSLFTIANIGLLSFIIVFLLRKLLMEKDRAKALSISLLAFTSLWLGQLIFLHYSLVESSSTILIGSQIARIASFAILLIIYYKTTKEVSADYHRSSQ